MRTVLLLGLVLVIGPGSSLRAQDIQVNARYSYYTHEEEGHLLIWGQDVHDVRRIRLFRDGALLAEVRPGAADLKSASASMNSITGASRPVSGRSSS